MPLTTRASFRRTIITTTIRTTLIMLLLAVFGLSASHAQGPEDSGLLALTGDDGNISIYDVANATNTPLTTDGDGQRISYNWPTWALDNTLAYFGVNLTGAQPYNLGVFIQPPDGPVQRVYASEDEIFTYAYWSPGECSAGDCRDLALLYTAASGNLALRQIRSAAVGVSISELSEGGPHYWDWSPDGRFMLWARYNAEFEIYDAESGEVGPPLSVVPGVMRAVDWAPSDDRLLVAVQSSGRGSNLMVIDDGRFTVLAEGLRGVVSFAWSPDGQRVAYFSSQDARLEIVNARDGSPVTSLGSNVLAFAWSPDGARIAYLTPQRDDGSTITKPSAAPDTGASAQRIPMLEWYVYDLESQTSLRVARFFPSQNMIYYLNFFDQFARSHSLWSRDSRYLAYGEFLVEDRTNRVVIVDTTQPRAEPAIIPGASMGVFNW